MKEGRLYCEICGFSFEKTYGELGKNFIEAHHKKPISQLADEEESSVDNLLMVCSNCHRMVHAGDPEKNLAMLMDLFGAGG